MGSFQFVLRVVDEIHFIALLPVQIFGSGRILGSGSTYIWGLNYPGKDSRAGACMIYIYDFVGDESTRTSAPRLAVSLFLVM